VLNDESVAGLLGLVMAYLPQSSSLQSMHAWSAIAVLLVDAFLKINKYSTYTFEVR